MTILWLKKPETNKKSDLMKPRQRVITSLKIIVYICNVAGLVWWADHSIKAYMEWPTASNVVLQNGDDGYGNVRFPVVTFCPESRLTKERALKENITRLMWKKSPLCKKVQNLRE